MSIPPAHEMADDYSAYRRERAAYERAQAREGGVVTPIPAPSADELARISARDRELALEHFTALAFAARRIRPTWQPSAFLERAMVRRGLTWAAVAAELSKRCGWCARTGSPLSASEGRIVCAECARTLADALR